MKTALLLLTAFWTAANTGPRTMTEEELFTHIDTVIQALLSRDKFNTASKQFVQAVWKDFKACHLDPSPEMHFSSVGMSGKIPKIESYDSYLGTYLIHYPPHPDGTAQPLRIYQKDNRFFVEMQHLKLPAIGRNKCIFFTSGQVVYSELPTMESGAYCRLLIYIVACIDGDYFMSAVGMPYATWDKIQKTPDK